MDVAVEDVLAFGPWRFDRRTGGLSRQDVNGVRLPVAIGSRAISVLRVLLDKPGDLVPKDVIRSAVWPRYVEPNNLTVQIAALRRVLDSDRVGESCIQTVPGRGYRFVLGVTELAKEDDDVEMSLAPPTDGSQAYNESAAPRFSIAVLPFVTPGNNRDEDNLAAAITEKLITDFCRTDGAVVSKDHAVVACRDDVRAAGGALKVRYIVNGRLSKRGICVHVNVQLVSTETDTYLWAYRFDHMVEDPSRSEDEIVCRIKAELLSRILTLESTRSVRERPDNPDAMDLLLRARALMRKHDQTELLRNVSRLLEQALRLDPSSLAAMCDLSSQLINRFVNDGEDLDNQDLLEQAMALVTAASVIEPNNDGVVYRQGYLARALGRWTEAIALLQRAVELSPYFSHGFRQLGFCKLAVGQPAAAIPLLEKSIYLDPLAPSNRYAYRRLSQAFLLLGQDAEAINWARRALAEDITGHAKEHMYCYSFMASALALIGQIEDARRALSEARCLNPFATVQTFLSPFNRRGLPDPVFVAMMDRIRQGLRIAGMREHADEHAVPGATPSGDLSRQWYGATPSSIPGATTILTTDLVNLLPRQRPVLIDTAFNSCGRSLPDAIGVQGFSHGATLSERVQTRFSEKIREITNADRLAPIVVYCANSERFTGSNMVRRLVELGYKQVYWYRGGWEAWLMAGLPTSDLTLQSW